MIPMDVVMEVVESSCVLAFGYDEENELLYVTFLTGKTMTYSVSPFLAAGMAGASSKGKFTYHVLRGHEVGYV